MVVDLLRPEVSAQQNSGICTSRFTTIHTHFKEYGDGTYRNTGVNAFWIINNSQQVLKVLHGVNGTSRALHMDSFDFSTLYTKIPRLIKEQS